MSKLGESPYLHLGCGAKYLEGWVNCDGAAAPVIEGVTGHPDLVLDVCTGLGALPSATLLWVYTSHLIEHIPPDLLPGALAHLHRALQTGGKLTIATTDLDGIYNHRHRSPDNGPYWECALFGDTTSTGHPFNAHRDCFTVPKLSRLLTEAGFATVRPWEYTEYPALAQLNDYGVSCRLVSCLVEGIK
jgi:predicted SAM-dependent methyltransferase